MVHTPAEVRLIVVGDGPERPLLERLARRLGVADRVDFRGRLPRDAVLGLLGAAAGAVFTGLREEGGLALAEAMAAGTPVVVLANGGARTIAASASDPSRVVLVEPGDVATTARRVGEAMTRLSQSPTGARGSTLDRAGAMRVLRSAFDEALAAGHGPHGAASGGGTTVLSSASRAPVPPSP